MGPIALHGAVIFATAALVVGRFRPEAERNLQRLSLGGVTLAIAHAVWLLASENSIYELVVDHTRPGLSVVRRVMGLWGGSAGSLLFFTFIIGGVLVIAPVVPRLRVVPSVVLLGLTCTSTFAANPFTTIDNPAIAGSGLSPILEHWAMIIHPPLLYLGLGLALVPAVVEPKHRRRAAMPAIAVLTVALALGGAWAYVELGWGGWYAWDPVENAALIPWLLLVASIHVVPDHMVARWFSALVWPTVFGGTAMTRTSLRTSVHSFANSDELGWFLWPLAAVVGIGAIAHAAFPPDAGSPKISVPQPTEIVDSGTEFSRLGRMVVPVVVVGYAAVVVALGTFRPFLPGEATDGAFYSRYLFPAAIIGLIALGLAPRRTTPVARLLGEALLGGLLGLGLATATGTTDWWQLTLAAALGISIVTTIASPQRPLPRTLAHLGMSLVLAGSLGGTASVSQTFPLELGESIVVDGHMITNRGIDFTDGPPPVITATVDVDGHTLRPGLSIYVERGLRLPEVATKRWLHHDVQLIIRNADDDGSVVLTANVEPLTQLVWIGALFISAGAVIGSRRPSTTTRPASLDEP